MAPFERSTKGTSFASLSRLRFGNTVLTVIFVLL